MDGPADLDEALRLLAANRDLLLERPHDREAPGWALERGWVEELLAIPDEALREAERAPASWLAQHGPAAFRGTARRAAELSARYRGPRSDGAPRARERHVATRKQTQIDAFLGAIDTFSEVTRIVDFGSGHGHLTRALARALTTDALGVERDPALVARARELGGRFVHADGERFVLEANDLVVGLHPCGALGDALVQRARQAGAHALMVSCCFQKIGGAERAWLSAPAAPLPRDVLGLANLAPRSFQGSGDLDLKRGWRRTRLAVRLLLQRRRVELGPGDEGRGVTKERFRAGLEDAACRALARRGLAPPSATELAEVEHEAHRVHARVARFALPRHALARVLELAIVLDRGQHLAERGWSVQVRALFSARTSPRNLAILAHAPG